MCRKAGTLNSGSQSFEISAHSIGAYDSSLWGKQEFPLRSVVCVYTYPTLTRNHDRGDRHVNDDETQTRCIAHRRVPASSDTLSSATLGASAHLYRRPTHCDALSHEYGMAYNSPSVARLTRCVPTRQTRSTRETFPDLMRV